MISWPAANEMNPVKPSMATEQSSLTCAAMASRMDTSLSAFAVLFISSRAKSTQPRKKMWRGLSCIFSHRLESLLRFFGRAFYYAVDNFFRITQIILRLGQRLPVHGAIRDYTTRQLSYDIDERPAFGNSDPARFFNQRFRVSARYGLSQRKHRRFGENDVVGARDILTHLRFIHLQVFR